MKAALWAAFLCECGWELCIDKARPNSIMRCTNPECQYFWKLFAIPSVELEEVPDTQVIPDGEECEQWSPR